MNAVRLIEFARIGALFMLALAMCGPAAAQDCPAGGGDFASFYRDAAQFEEAIGKAERMVSPQGGMTGVTVPHHLVARDLIAAGIRLASGATYDRIVLLFPDHFRRAKMPFATSARGFETVFGHVPADGKGARALLASAVQVEDSCLFAKDHGIHALLPFVRHYLPDVPVLPVAISIGSSRRDWDSLIETLMPLVDDRTLVLQSTDFSHYLPHARARQRDQETLNILAAGAFDQLARLIQPDHVDSAGALYIQMAIQARRDAGPSVLFNRNQQEYWPTALAETTSYMVLAFGLRAAPAGSVPGSRLLYIAGDTMFGRGMTNALLDEKAIERVTDAVLKITGGNPLMLNLEGVLLPEVPSGLEHMTLAMPAALALDWFGRLNVAAVSLANNHAMDLGHAGYQETVTALREAGIPFVGQGELVERTGLTIVGLTDIGTNNSGAVDLIDHELLAKLREADPEKPILGFVHWGREYRGEPGPREKAVTDMLLANGVSAIIGAHPHVAGDRLESLAGGAALRLYSLGNFLFDQNAATSSGAMVELRIFEQGTYFARLVGLPNLYEVARGTAAIQQPPKPSSR